MKLFSGPLSSFTAKVRIALAEKRIACERIEVPFSRAHGYSPKLPEVLALNPKGQVPVLVDGALAVYDSTIILEYLERVTRCRRSTRRIPPIARAAARPRPRPTRSTSRTCGP